jgi:hypothetical protein
MDRMEMAPRRAAAQVAVRQQKLQRCPKRYV